MELTIKNLLFILFSVTMLGQNFNTNDFDTDSNIDIIRKEVALRYKPKDVSYYGSKYYFKQNQTAFIRLYETDEPLRVMTNYNLVDETFDIKTSVDIFKLSPNKVMQVNFKDNSFVSINGKFYELLFKSALGFQLVAEIFIKVEIPYYTPGIQPKPDPNFRKVNELKINIGDKLRKIDRNKGFVSNMFGKEKSKEVKSFIKQNKIKVRNPEQLGLLIETFYKNLDL